MGTREREIFLDDRFSESLNTAKQAMLLHCMSDLVVFASALVEPASSERSTLARRWYVDSANAADPELPETLLATGLQDFETRLQYVDWEVCAERDNAFTQSPQGLLDCAPVIAELKQLDAEVVRNSVRFRWTDVRRQLRSRLDRTAF